MKTEITLAHIYAAAGRKADARRLVKKMDEGSLGGNDFRGMALVYTALGENDKAFEWLDKSVDMHEESLCSLKVDPTFDPLHSDPLYNEILKK